MTNPPEVTDTPWWRYWLRELGVLRVTLLATALMLLILVPTPGARAVFSGWPLVTTVLTPVLAPLVMMVLLLDALMARVFLTDAAGAERRRFRVIILANLAVAAILLLRWLPFYAAMRV